MRGRSLPHTPTLDGIRAIAVLTVFAHHVFPWSGIPGLGVDVFFAISGWLITRILLREFDKNGKINLGKFYAKRALRLYPPLLVTVATFLLLWFTQGQPFTKVLESSAWSLTYLSNIAMTAGWSQVLHLAHTWSLAMEEQFYVIWPLVLILMLTLKMPRGLMLTLLGVGTAISFASWVLLPDQPFNPISRAGAMLVGCAVAILVEKKPWQNTPIAYIAALAITGVVFAHTFADFNYTATTWIVIGLTPLVILHAAFGQSFITRLLSAPWLVYIGVISYEIYLWHYPIFRAVRDTGDFTGAQVGLITLILTLTASALSHMVLAKPIAKFRARIDSPKPAPEAVLVPA
ncbi:acyltransferase family protein [Microterricola viridarii]|uniref:Acyltransferase 3 domain-containing protein n=1 Tax=Microterricola viridarii TaxID=412690 RepID=A0A0X8E4J9_9MICO|nr:acyltransferase [Microterricola viridarii]AMB59587.1 hypothetical protein AWU67_12715 [Microterricola viridarii]